jgi:hypothetical protein
MQNRKSHRTLSARIAKWNGSHSWEFQPSPAGSRSNFIDTIVKLTPFLGTVVLGAALLLVTVIHNQQEVSTEKGRVTASYLTAVPNLSEQLADPKSRAGVITILGASGYEEFAVKLALRYPQDGNTMAAAIKILNARPDLAEKYMYLLLRNSVTYLGRSIRECNMEINSIYADIIANVPVGSVAAAAKLFEKMSDDEQDKWLAIKIRDKANPLFKLIKAFLSTSPSLVEYLKQNSPETIFAKTERLLLTLDAKRSLYYSSRTQASIDQGKAVLAALKKDYAEKGTVEIYWQLATKFRSLEDEVKTTNQEWDTYKKEVHRFTEAMQTILACYQQGRAIDRKSLAELSAASTAVGDTGAPYMEAKKIQVMTLIVFELDQIFQDDEILKVIQMGKVQH